MATFSAVEGFQSLTLLELVTNLAIENVVFDSVFYATDN